MMSQHEEKGYISHSGWKLYVTDRDKYVEKYVFGIQPEPSRAMKYGKCFARGFEDRSYPFAREMGKIGARINTIKKFENGLRQMPVLPKEACEYKFRQPFTGLDLYGFLDGYLEEYMHVIEIKTGSQLWTQERVDNDTQLTFYALWHFLKYNRVPKRITLFWLNTSTGEVKSFETQRSELDVLEFMRRVDTTIEDILNHRW